MPIYKKVIILIIKLVVNVRIKTIKKKNKINL